MMLFYRFARPLSAPLFNLSFSLPRKIKIDRPLVLGSAAFGIGWGVSGLCPGPAIAVLGLAPSEVALFAGAMLVGSWLVSVIISRGDVPEKPIAKGDVPAT